MKQYDAMLEAIGYPLPEDIEKLKWAGEFAACEALMARRLQEDIPETLRRKLEMEKRQIARMRRSYTIPAEEAEAIMARRLRDYRPGELEALRQRNLADWCFSEGQVRYIDDFFENLMKICPELRARQIDPAPEETPSETEKRLDTARRMAAEGGGAYRMRLRAAVELHTTARDTARLWVPVPIEGFQVRNLRILSATPEITELAPGLASQRTAYFEGPAEILRRAELTYEFENHTRYVSPDPEAVSPDQPEGYLEEQLPHIVFTPCLRALAAEIVGEETNPLRKARRIYNFVTQKVIYSYMRGYLSLPVIPEYCAARLRGDCGVQALTFITLCRIAGIPARWQSGLYASRAGTEAWSHDWAMFYVAPFGWMFTDCSYGGAAWRDGNRELWDFYFCNLDPKRVVLASAFQEPFQPASAFLRHDPYDNQKGEAELRSRALSREEFSGGAEILEMERLPWPGE